jgi:probable HAF family extracellular repeat protein
MFISTKAAIVFTAAVLFLPLSFARAQTASSFLPPPSYSLLDLGTDISFHQVTGVNNLGQVTGSATIGGVSQAFLSGPRGMGIFGLGTLSGSFSSGNAINNLGQVAGTSDVLTDIGDTGHTFLSGANGGSLKDLGALPGGSDFSSAAGLNDKGQVVGFSRANGDAHAFVSGVSGGPLKDLGTLLASGAGLNYGAYDRYSEATGINNSGQVTGFSYDFRDGSGSDAHAFLSAVNGVNLRDLGTLGGNVSRGLAVNNAGQVTGFAFTAQGNSNATEHAFLSGANGGTLQDLGTLGGKFSAGSSVNNQGQVVGQSELLPDALGHIHDDAFMFSGNKMYDLNSLILPGSTLVLQNAIGISDTGYITGTAYDSLDGRIHFYLLTPNAPVPEASTTISFGLLIALGLGGLAVAVKRKQIAASA